MIMGVPEFGMALETVPLLIDFLDVLVHLCR